MRIVKEQIIDDIKITLFSWNNKLLLKFENGGFEQTYKFSEMDYSSQEIENILKEGFISKIKKTFHQMHLNLSETLNG